MDNNIELLTASEFIVMIKNSDDNIMKGNIQRLNNLNDTDKKGCTPLISAVRFNMPITAGLLVSQGADVDIKDLDGYSALLYASENNDPSIAVMLLEAGANPNITNKEGWTPLMWATFLGLYETVSFLLIAGADVGIRNSSGMTALDIARFRHNENVEGLIEHYIINSECPIPIGAKDCPDFNEVTVSIERE